MKKIVLFVAILLAFGILPMAAWPDPGDMKVIIPNQVVYERSGFGHLDYEGSIQLQDDCPPYHGISPGDVFEIPIILSEFEPEFSIGGFQLELEFDYVDMTFFGAMRGVLLENRVWQVGVPPGDSTFWSWEYFTYRVLPCPTCACCKYKILLYGRADMPAFDLVHRGYCLTTEYLNHPTYSTYWAVDSTEAGQEVGATLVWLKFQVAHNQLLWDLKLPIFFEWEHKLDPDSMVIIEDWDCAENTMSDCEGNNVYVSKDPLQYEPTVCPDGENILTILDFVDGGVSLCGPICMIECVRGDIDLNLIAYETADAVLFARYFVHGVGVFTIDPEAQACATDVNADGRDLMLADLIYLIRVIQRDAITYPPLIPKLGPSSDLANLIVSDGRISVECASEIGGILFEFDGAVTPTLLNTDMELMAHEGKVLVWSSEGKSIQAGVSDLLTFAGAQHEFCALRLVSVTAVDREGRDLATTITTKVAPSGFALYPAYPNPFNPYTNLSFTLPRASVYGLKIYNVAGQLVRSYEGMANAGLNLLTWDGKDNLGEEVASGVYFYKLMAGKHGAIRKMVMLK